MADELHGYTDAQRPVHTPQRGGEGLVHSYEELLNSWSMLLPKYRVRVLAESVLRRTSESTFVTALVELEPSLLNVLARISIRREKRKGPRQLPTFRTKAGAFDGMQGSVRDGFSENKKPLSILTKSWLREADRPERVFSPPAWQDDTII